MKILTTLLGLTAAHRLSHRMRLQEPSETDATIFAELDKELDQIGKNIGQGVLGRQLGLTKVVSMKLHVHELEKSL